MPSEIAWGLLAIFWTVVGLVGGFSAGLGCGALFRRVENRRLRDLSERQQTLVDQLNGLVNEQHEKLREYQRLVAGETKTRPVKDQRPN
jgi:hypothetical protein